MNSSDLNDSIDTWITEVARPYLETQFLIWILHKYNLSVNRIPLKTLGIVRVATMTSNGTPTAPPFADQPPSPSPTLKSPGTTFDSAAWAEAPPFLLQVPNRNERIAIRNCQSSSISLNRHKHHVAQVYTYTKSYIFIHNLFSRLGHLMLLAREAGEILGAEGCK
jgi:hypothetical protein